LEDISKIIDHVLDRLENKLSPVFVYHSAIHTQYVVRKAQFLADKEKQDAETTRLITLGALYHDIGFLIGVKDHEEAGCAITKTELTDYRFTPAEVNAVCGMIMATKIPQTTHNIAEKIVADADLYYLGTEHFESIGNLLFEELNLTGANLTREAWNHIQIKFLTAHSYQTEYGKAHLEPVKQAHLRALIANT
jgi:uncharacterized protein